MKSLVMALLVCATANAAELGLNVHQSTDVGLDIAHDAKVKWVRVDMNWLDAEPASGSYNWTLFDTQVANAAARGLSVLAVLAYTPAWASAGDTKSDGPNNDVPMAGAYASFVSAAVTHFAGKITHYELWNEPNLAQFWEGTPQQYIDLILKPGADALKGACATCVVVGPALATVGMEYANWMEAVFSQAKDKLDIVSGHDYAGFGTGVTADNFFQKLEMHRLITAGGVTLYEGPLSFKEEMDKHGLTQPFWMTETGLEAPYGDAAKMDAQKVNYQNVLAAMATRGWWTNTIFYEAFDESGSGYTWGVALHDAMAANGYDAKPAMGVLQGGVPVVDGGVPVDAAGGEPPADLATGQEPPPDLATPAGDAPRPDSTGGCSMAPVAPFGGVALILLLAVGVLRFRR